jgi:hypothetical protein
VRGGSCLDSLGDLAGWQRLVARRSRRPALARLAGLVKTRLFFLAQPNKDLKAEDNTADHRRVLAHDHPDPTKGSFPDVRADSA